MAVKLNQGIVDKIKGEFPALSINQIASKYGVAWATVRNIVSPPNGSPAKKAGHDRAKHAVNGDANVEAIVNAAWDTLSLPEKLTVLLRRK